MASPLVTKQEISSYIPQKDPIVMIDTIEEVSELLITTNLKVRIENIFIKGNRLSEPGLIENIAQTAAAKAGYEVKKHGREPLIGFIGAIKDLKIFDLPLVGETVETRVTIKNEVMGVTIVQGLSQAGGRQLAECEMKIFLRQPEDEKNA